MANPKMACIYLELDIWILVFGLNRTYNSFTPWCIAQFCHVIQALASFALTMS